MSVHQTLAHNLRTAIDSSSLQIKQICHTSGYSPSYIGKVLAGMANPTLMFIDCMAKTLNVTPARLLNEEQSDD